MSDLLKRIDVRIDFWKEGEPSTSPIVQLLRDCRAEIERLKVDNSELERAIKMQGGVQARLCEHQLYLEAEIAKRKYVPMTDDEAFEVTNKLMADGHGFVSGDCICAIEAAVIKRAGLDVA